jgi:hypothetical protein
MMQVEIWSLSWMPVVTCLKCLHARSSYDYDVALGSPLGWQQHLQCTKNELMFYDSTYLSSTFYHVGLCVSKISFLLKPSYLVYLLCHNKRTALRLFFILSSSQNFLTTKNDCAPIITNCDGAGGQSLFWSKQKCVDIRNDKGLLVVYQMQTEPKCLPW